MSTKVSTDTAGKTSTGEEQNSSKSASLGVTEYDIPKQVFVAPLKENTRDFTRRRSPNSQYWKAPLSFGSATSNSYTVHVPLCPIVQNPTTNERYAVEYIYAGIPIELRNKIVNALKVCEIICSVQDNKSVVNSICPWVLMSPVAGRFFAMTRPAGLAQSISSGFLM